VSWQLRVEEPAAATPLAGAKIAQRDSDGSFGVFRGARWSERAPELIQGAIVRSFEDSGRIRGVGRSTSSVRGDYLLLMELRYFEADYSGSGGPVVRFALSAKLIGAKDNEAVAARVFSETEPAAGRDLAAIVKAFKACAERLIPQLRDWALESGQVQASATPDR
jgi:cholesterol transport system auxiliary component